MTNTSDHNKNQQGKRKQPKTDDKHTDSSANQSKKKTPTTNVDTKYKQNVERLNQLHQQQEKQIQKISTKLCPFLKKSIMKDEAKNNLEPLKEKFLKLLQCASTEEDIFFVAIKASLVYRHQIEGGYTNIEEIRATMDKKIESLFTGNTKKKIQNRIATLRESSALWLKETPSTNENTTKSSSLVHNITKGDYRKSIGTLEQSLYVIGKMISQSQKDPLMQHVLREYETYLANILSSCLYATGGDPLQILKKTKKHQEEEQKGGFGEIQTTFNLAHLRLDKRNTMTAKELEITERIIEETKNVCLKRKAYPLAIQIKLDHSLVKAYQGKHVTEEPYEIYLKQSLKLVEEGEKILLEKCTVSEQEEITSYTPGVKKLHHELLNRKTLFLFLLLQEQTEEQKKRDLEQDLKKTLGQAQIFEKQIGTTTSTPEHLHCLNTTILDVLINNLPKSIITNALYKLPAILFPEDTSMLHHLQRTGELMSDIYSNSSLVLSTLKPYAQQLLPSQSRKSVQQFLQTTLAKLREKKEPLPSLLTEETIEKLINDKQMAQSFRPETKATIETLLEQSLQNTLSLQKSFQIIEEAVDILYIEGMRIYSASMLNLLGALHDIGKTGIPLEILYAKRKLTKKEENQINQHPQYGTNLLSRILILQDINALSSIDVCPFFTLVQSTVGKHHLLQNITAEEVEQVRSKEPQDEYIIISLITICNLLDALLSTCLYDDGLSIKEIRMIIEQELGKKVPPELLDKALQFVYDHYLDITKKYKKSES